MKSSKLDWLLVLLAISQFLCINNAAGQGSVPPELTAIVKMKLDAGQERLKSLGYEICSSSFIGKKQDWFNESTKNCVTVKFDKKTEEIVDVILNPNTSECQNGLNASRKVWEKYHDGQAPVSSAKIDAERKKLSDQGFTVSYWINEVSPGRCSEYWVNKTSQKTMFIVWEIQGSVWVMTDSTDYKMGENPAPKK